VTRKEAIDNIRAAYGAYIQEFCAGLEEQTEAWQECEYSLAALGCTTEELKPFLAPGMMKGRA